MGILDLRVVFSLCLSHGFPICTCIQVFYELHAERERQGKQNDVAIVRIEQLAPFPFDLVCREIYRYPNAELVWCQEEPMNMGAYFHIQVGTQVLHDCYFGPDVIALWSSACLIQHWQPQAN